MESQSLRAMEGRRPRRVVSGRRRQFSQNAVSAKMLYGAVESFEKTFSLSIAQTKRMTRTAGAL